MMRLLNHPLSIVACLCLILGVDAQDWWDWDNIMVVAPTAFQQAHRTGFAAIPALFGFPKRGEELTGLVVNMPEDNQDGCHPITPPANWPGQQETVFALIERGNCYFVTKVRNAQMAGVDAVIMINNVDGNNVRMADDGTASDVTIPSMFISRADGAALKTQVNQTKLVMSMSWNSPHEAHDRIPWSFWTSSNDVNSVEFKRNFAPLAKMLGDSAPMTPHYLMFSGATYGCQEPGNPCQNLCILNNAYCATDPEDDPNSGLDGADVVNMNLYQLCVNQLYKTSGWFDFVNVFNTLCANGPQGPNFGQPCADSVATQLQLNVALIHSCIVNNGPSLLAAQLTAKAADGIYYLPSLMVDDEEYSGSMKCESPTRCEPLRAICEAFPQGSAPSVCTTSPGCALGVTRDACGVCGGNNGTMDACGVCVGINSKFFNHSCAGCDGVPNSGKKHDACGVCGGTITSFSECVQLTPTAAQAALVNASLLADMATLRAEILSLKSSINTACLVKPPNEPHALAASSSSECPPLVHDNGGGGKQTAAIVVALVLVIALLGGGVGVIVWRRRRLNVYVRAHSSLDNEDNTTASSSSAKGRHALLVDEEEASSSSSSSSKKGSSTSFSEAEPEKIVKPSKSKKSGKAGNVEINVPLMDKSTDEDL